MDVCKNCGAELTHVEGRRKKEFCSDNCRAKFWQKNTKNKAPKTVAKDSPPQKQVNTGNKSELEKLEAELEGLGNSSYLFDYKRKLKAKIENLKKQ